MSILERHTDKWIPEPNSGCYLWTGSLNSQKYQPRPWGWDGQKTVLIARAVCEEVYGPLGDKSAAHKRFCSNPLCVNGDHLYPATHAENMADKSYDELSLRRRGLPAFVYRNADGMFIVRLNTGHVGLYGTFEEAVRIRDERLKSN